MTRCLVKKPVQKKKGLVKGANLQCKRTTNFETTRKFLLVFHLIKVTMFYGEQDILNPRTRMNKLWFKITNQ